MSPMYIIGWVLLVIIMGVVAFGVYAVIIGRKQDKDYEELSLPTIVNDGLDASKRDTLESLSLEDVMRKDSPAPQRALQEAMPFPIVSSTTSPMPSPRAPYDSNDSMMPGYPAGQSYGRSSEYGDGDNTDSGGNDNNSNNDIGINLNEPAYQESVSLPTINVSVNSEYSMPSIDPKPSSSDQDYSMPLPSPSPVDESLPSLLSDPFTSSTGHESPSNDYHDEHHDNDTLPTPFARGDSPTDVGNPFTGGGMTDDRVDSVNNDPTSNANNNDPINDPIHAIDALLNSDDTINPFSSL